jgi:hypothetical protein
MASVLFLLVMVNPKDESFGNRPLVYAVLCFMLAVITNWLAKRSENSD